MRANFEKLRQDIADRKAGKIAPSTDTSTPTTLAESKVAEECDTSCVGVWRHFCALDTSIKQEFYVNSVTHEIRTELPSPLVQEQSPANRYDDLNGVARAVVDIDSAIKDQDDTVTPLKSKARTKRAIALAFASPDATSEFQSAIEEIVVPEHKEKTEEEKQDTLGKHTRSDASSDLTADVSAEEIEDASETPKKWQCSRCTLINEATCQQCEACGYETPSAPAPKRLRKKLHFQSKISL